MLININEIKVSSNRREALPEDVKALAESIADVGMMNPITVDLGNNLVAGLHRLEAAKLLGWTEIECNVCELDELHAELAEIDENVVRTGLSDLELSELLARRKKIYETLHPETRHGGDRKSEEIKSSICRDDSAKSFAEDTAEKMGVSPRTVERSVQIAENLTPEAKEVLRTSERKITKQNLTKLSRLEPERQGEAAQKLVSGDIKSVDEYSAGPANGAIANDSPDWVDSVFSHNFSRFYERADSQLREFLEDYNVNFLHMTEEDVHAFEKQAQTMRDALDELLKKVTYSFAHADELKAKYQEEEMAEEAAGEKASA